MKFAFQKYKYFIFDLDGTIYRGNKVIERAAETINHLSNLGNKIVFVSNKTTESAYNYFHFLKNLGVKIHQKQSITSTIVLKNHLS